MKKWLTGVVRLGKLVWSDIAGSFTAPKPIILITLATALILIGQIGLLIPIFPGLLFTVPGLVLLSLYSPTIYRKLKQRVSGHPKIESLTDRTRNWLIHRIRPRK